MNQVIELWHGFFCDMTGRVTSNRTLIFSLSFPPFSFKISLTLIIRADVDHKADE